MIRLEQLRQVMEEKGYAFFTRGQYNLNIIGVRSASTATNRFDDALYLAYVDALGWQFVRYPITTDPGRYWLGSRFGGRMGTAILKEGQYRASHRIGLHKGDYEALVQARPVTVLRDVDRDGELDFSSGIEETGMFGINIHRAHPGNNLVEVGAWSAGCQVFQRPSDFLEFMRIVRRAADIWGDVFSYTLLHERDFQ